jgi:starch phosphorylase
VPTASIRLRLWAAAAPESFDFAEFSQGDFAGAVIAKCGGGIAHARALSRRLHRAGRALRFLQQYFMVSCSLQDIIARFRKGNGGDWSACRTASPSR